MSKSIEQVRAEFNRTGTSISHWARENNFPPTLVYQILSNTRIPVRGKSHLIAVKLGIKK